MTTVWDRLDRLVVELRELRDEPEENVVEELSEAEFREYLEWLKTPDASTSRERWQPRSRSTDRPTLTLIQGGA